MRGQDIEIAEIRKKFGATDVLKGIDLDIRRGEFLTLLGPSGCGKSTLLRLIAGFEPPTSGTIRIGNRDITDVPPKERDVAMVFQSYALYPHMSVRKNVAIPLEMRRLSFAQRLPGMGLFSGRVRQVRQEIGCDVLRVCEQLGIDALLDRKPSQLSGGQRQRVAVGRAMVRDPSVFLMDEPLSNLDANLRNQLREEIADLHRRTGITFIFVTHDQREAMSLSDRIALMQDGQLVQCGTPAEIYGQPRQISVARFVGSVSINEIPVQIENEELTAGGIRLGLHAPGAIEGPHILAVRVEAFDVVPLGKGLEHFQLPIEHVEFSGSEVFVRCNGNDVGTDRVRVQVPAEQFERFKQCRNSGDRIALRMRLHGVHLFDSSGARSPIALVDRLETNQVLHAVRV